MTTATPTEKACTKCGVTKPLTAYYRDKARRDGHAAHCKVCASASQKAYREANAERIAAYDKAYHEANAERILARNKAYHEANAERIAARKKAYHAERLATDAEYRARRKAVHTRRRRLLANAKSEPYLRDEIFARDGWVCGICDEPIDPQVQWPDPACATIDHIVPLSRGGDDTPANVQAAHGSCNYGKCDRVAREDEDLGVAA